MSDVDQVRLIKSQTLAVLAEITTSPKPSYAIDGQRVSWSYYLAQLRDTVAWCDRQLAAAVPGEVRSQGYS